MSIKPIKTPASHRAALKKIESLMNAKSHTASGDRLDALVKRVEAYERTRFPMKRLRPVHPGDILANDFMTPLRLSPHELAEAIGVSVRAVSATVRRRRAVTAEMALRLSLYLGTTARLWLDLQNQYDLEIARHKMGKRLERIIQPLARPDLSHGGASYLRQPVLGAP